MDLKAYEKRRVRDLYRRITKNLNSRRRYAERKGRSYTPDMGSVTSAFPNLLNGGSSFAAYFPRNYCLSNCQRVTLMSLIKRVMIGESSSRRLGSRPQRIVE